MNKNVARWFHHYYEMDYSIGVCVLYDECDNDETLYLEIGPRRTRSIENVDISSCRIMVVKESGDIIDEDERLRRFVSVYIDKILYLGKINVKEDNGRYFLDLPEILESLNIEHKPIDSKAFSKTKKFEKADYIKGIETTGIVEKDYSWLDIEIYSMRKLFFSNSVMIDNIDLKCISASCILYEEPLKAVQKIVDKPINMGKEELVKLMENLSRCDFGVTWDNGGFFKNSFNNEEVVVLKFEKDGQMEEIEIKLFKNNTELKAGVLWKAVHCKSYEDANNLKAKVGILQI